MPQVESVVDRKRFPTSKGIESTKRSLSLFCNEYLNGVLSEAAFGSHARALMSNTTTYFLSLLLKRAEVTCGKHFCTFWNECASGVCQYKDASIPWEEDVFMFQKLDLSKLPRTTTSFEAIQVTNNTTRVDTLELQLKNAMSSITTLQGQITKETNARLLLENKVEKLSHIVARLDAIYENKQSPSKTLSSGLRPFQHLPIIDLSRPVLDVAIDIDAACRSVGFMYIVNHGVSETLITKMRAYSKSFFELSLSQKEKMTVLGSSSGIRGFFRLGQENLQGKDSTRDLEKEEKSPVLQGTLYKGDLKEGFDTGREITDQDIDFECPLVDVNRWPEEDVLPGFKETVLEYQKELLKVTDKLLVAFALGLNLPRDYFTKHAKNPMVTLRLLHYPPQEVLDTNQMGCGAHTDYGLCTVLHQDDVGGLQVRNSDHEWIDAPPVPNSFVINIGDMLSRWTDGVYSSTVHRVVNNTGSERYSMPFFFNPDVNTPIASISKSNVFPPITSDALLLERYTQTFAHLKK